MQNDKEYWIPRNLDAPRLFFVWELDNAMVYIVWMLIGLTSQMFLLGCFMAITMGRGYTKLKEEGGRGLIARFLYWFTPSELWLSKKLPSNVREFIGG